MRRSAAAGVVLPFVIFWSTLDRSIVLPLVPEIGRDVGVPLAVAAGIIAAHAIAYSGMQVLWGPLSTRWGRIRVLALSTGLAALANVACAFAPDITVLLIARMASGGAFAATFAAVLTYIGDMLPLARRPAAMSNLATAVALGLALGTLVAGALALWVSWRVIFLGFAVVTAALVPVIMSLPESLDHESRSVRTQLSRLVRNRWALGVCLLTGLEGFLLIGIFNILPAALQQSGSGVFVSGLVTAAFGATVIAASQLMKLAVAKVSPVVFLAAGGACATVGMLVLVWQVTPFTVLAGAGLMGVGWALAHTTMQTWMTDAAADSRALGMTLFSISLMLGGALGAAVGALAAGSAAYPALFGIGVAGAVVFTVGAATSRAKYRVRDA